MFQIQGNIFTWKTFKFYSKCEFSLEENMIRIWWSGEIGHFCNFEFMPKISED